MEHRERSRWFYRWRMVGDYPPGYLEWREGESRSARVLFSPERAGCVVEAEWRGSESDDWRQVALHEAACGTLPVRVVAGADGVSFEDEVELLAVVGGMVASYSLPPFSLGGGEEMDHTAVACGKFADNLVLAGEVFAPLDPRVKIVSTGPTVGGTLGVDGVGRLEGARGCRSRRLFAWSGVMAADSSQTQ